MIYTFTTNTIDWPTLGTGTATGSTYTLPTQLPSQYVFNEVIYTAPTVTPLPAPATYPIDAPPLPVSETYELVSTSYLKYLESRVRVLEGEATNPNYTPRQYIEVEIEQQKRKLILD